MELIRELPSKLKNALPTIEQIETEINEFNEDN